MPPANDTQPESHPAPIRRALLLLNKRARGGDSRMGGAVDKLQAAGIVIVDPGAHDRDEVTDIIRSHAGTVDCVIVAGGDGSMNSAGRGLFETGLPLGVIPCGTANDLARTLGIAASPATAADIIIRGHSRRIDLGEANGLPFFNVASIGFSARLVRDLGSEEKRRWGRLGYARAALRLLSRAVPFHATFQHDGQRIDVKTMQISVGNGRYYGGGMRIDAGAEPDDGMLNVYSLEIHHWLRLLTLAPALRLGLQAGRPGVRTFATTALTVTTRHTREVDLDGDIATETPVRFTIRPRAIRVFAPAPAR